MIDLLFTALVWMTLGVNFRRSQSQWAFMNIQAIYIWSLFILVGLVFLLRADPIQQIADELAGGQPMGYLLQANSILSATIVYTIILQHVVPLWIWLYKILVGLQGAVFVANFGIIGLGFARQITSLQAHYTMMTFSDLAVFAVMILIFLPANIQMLRREQHEPMKFKHVATIAFCMTYALAAGLTLYYGPVAVHTGYVSPMTEIVPLGPILTLCVIVQLLPHRILHDLLHPLRIYRYLCLRQKEAYVLQLAGKELAPLEPLDLFLPNRLRTVTYLSTINILDASPLAAMLSDEGQHFMERMQNIDSLDIHYERLVTRLARMKL